jgi:hypothetical protein
MTTPGTAFPHRRSDDMPGLAVDQQQPEEAVATHSIGRTNPPSSESASQFVESSLAALASPWLESLENLPYESDDEIHTCAERDGERVHHDREDPMDLDLASTLQGATGYVLSDVEPPVMEDAPHPPISEDDSSASARLMGDFEKEVKLRVADYREDLKDAMRQVYDRFFASMRHQKQEQRQRQEVQQQAYEGGARSGGNHDNSWTANMPMKDEAQHSKDSVAVSATPINSRHWKRMERQLSKKRQRFILLLSSYEQRQRVSHQAELGVPLTKQNDDDFWGELVTQRQRRLRRSNSVMEPQLPAVVNLLPTTRKKRKEKVKTSASGRLSHVHRDLKGGGDSGAASTTRLAASRLLKASLTSDGTQRALRTHARMLVLALMYAAVVSIVIRMFTWALWIRR